MWNPLQLTSGTNTRHCLRYLMHPNHGLISIFLLYFLAQVLSLDQRALELYDPLQYTLKESSFNLCCNSCQDVPFHML